MFLDVSTDFPALCCLIECFLVCLPSGIHYTATSVIVAPTVGSAYCGKSEIWPANQIQSATFKGLIMDALSVRLPPTYPLLWCFRLLCLSAEADRSWGGSCICQEYFSNTRIWGQWEAKSVLMTLKSNKNDLVVITTCQFKSCYKPTTVHSFSQSCTRYFECHLLKFNFNCWAKGTNTERPGCSIKPLSQLAPFARQKLSKVVVSRCVPSLKF